MWTTLHSYRDVISNGLDLLSFLLVTPEILRFSRPALGKLTYWIGSLAIISIIYFVLPAPLPLIPIPGQHVRSPADMPPSVAALVLFGTIALFVAVYWLLRLWEDKGHTVGQWASSHAFALGVALFFLSRMIAFITALADALAAAN